MQPASKYSGVLLLRTIHSSVLQRAAELVGGAEALAACLGIPQAWLQAWMRGEGMPPTNVFLRAVDIITERSLEESLRVPGRLRTCGGAD